MSNLVLSGASGLKISVLDIAFIMNDIKQEAKTYAAEQFFKNLLIVDFDNHSGELDYK